MNIESSQEFESTKYRPKYKLIRHLTMNNISKNIFSTEKIQHRQSRKANFFKQIKPIQPLNVDSIFENSWIQSSENSINKTYYSKNRSNLTSLANNKMTKTISYGNSNACLLYTSPSPRDLSTSRMPSSA